MNQIKTTAQQPFEELIQTIEQLNSSELEQLISQVMRIKAHRQAPSLPQDQSFLLHKINQSIPFQDHYNTLIAKRQSETLTIEEYEDLLRLSAQIEELEAKRIEYLTELATLRQTSLTDLIQELHLSSP